MKRKLKELEKIEKKILFLERQKRLKEQNEESKKEEFENYVKRHKSLKFDEIRSCDTKKLAQIYKYFDDKYPICWQGGLRNDDRGMALCYWCFDKDDYLELHLHSTCDNICFGGSTSWLVYAPTLEEKVEKLKQIKKDMLKILK